MKLKVYLSIGFPTANHEEIIDVDDNELASCKTEEEREKLLSEYWTEWASGYIDGGHELVEED